MHLPTIISHTLTLRHPQPDDALALFGYASDHEVTALVPWQRHRKIIDSQKFIGAICDRPKTLFFVIVHTMHNRVIGECGLIHITSQEAEIHYTLARAYWGQGLATQAVNTVIEYAFTQLNLMTITAWIIADNIRSMNVAERCGMHRQTHLPHHWLINETLHDVYIYVRHR